MGAQAGLRYLCSLLLFRCVLFQGNGGTPALVAPEMVVAVCVGLLRIIATCGLRFGAAVWHRPQQGTQYPLAMVERDHAEEGERRDPSRYARLHAHGIPKRVGAALGCSTRGCC